MNDTRQGSGAHGNTIAPTRRASRAAKRSGVVALTRGDVRPLLMLGAVLLVAALIGVATLKAVDRLRPTGASVTAPQPLLRLTPLAEGLKCVEQVAWSPDSAQVAVMGNTQTCGSSSLYAQTTRILVYDARSGQISQQLQPDLDVIRSGDVRQALYDNWDDPHAIPQLTYTNLVWTPDHRSLLLPFALHVSGVSHPDDTPIKGLLREGVVPGALTSVWLDRLWRRPANTLELWDLSLAYPADAPTPTTGIHLPVGPQPVAVVAPLPGERYRWDSTGELTSSGAATGAVGVPSGGQSFTIWQAGVLSYLPPASAGGPAILWTAQIAPVSPDGRYFYTAVPATGALVPPSTLSAGAPLTTLPTLAPHDKALQTLAAQLGQVAATDATTPLLVTWRPDGQMLAVVKQTPATLAGAVTVSLYNTATGALVEQLTPDFSGLTAGPASTETLQWSPDGKQLLFSDVAYGSLTLWGPGKLPA